MAHSIQDSVSDGFDSYSVSRMLPLKNLTWSLCDHLPEAERRRIYRKVVIKFSCYKSGESQPYYEDENAVCRGIEKQLRLLGKSDDEFLLFNFLYRRLRTDRAQKMLTNRTAVLSFLLKLSRGRPEKHVSAAGSNFELSRTGQSYNDKPRHLSVFSRDYSSEKPINVFQCHKQVGRCEMGLPSHCDSLSLMSAMPRVNLLSSEESIIQELIYTFQGVPGNMFQLHPEQGFVINPNVKIRQYGVVLSLLELGYLHNRVVAGCSTLSKNGSVDQAIETAIRQVLADYYHLVSGLHTNFNRTKDKGNDDHLLREGSAHQFCRRVTLRALVHWVSHPMSVMRVLCDVLHFISGCKGGAIISQLCQLRHHGDPQYNKICQPLLSAGGKPLMQMIKAWLVSGDLCDPYNEFFIAINEACSDRDLWNGKFILRETLIPSVMSKSQADKVLRCGKGIHFLNTVCGERVPIKGSRQMLETSDLEITDMQSNNELPMIVHGIFQETSSLVLNTLVEKFKLFLHFHGIQRYILMGRGDFAQLFMELVEPQMRKPSAALDYNELMALLSAAIRGSSAVFDDQDILMSVSVKLLLASQWDWGSDVFELQYIVNPTVDAVFGLGDGSYSQLFKFLWCTKRMEFILLNLRKERWATKNAINALADKIPQINSVLILADRISHELEHFARQLHYYIFYDVVECQWEKFSNTLKKAKTLDEVIEAHALFIRDLKAQTFQDENSQIFINKIRLIWDLVLELETVEKAFFRGIQNEIENREQRDRRLSLFGTCYEEEDRFNKSCKTYLKALKSSKAEYTIILRNLQNILKKFLYDISTRKDPKLRKLGLRLDFNEYYDVSNANTMTFTYCGEVLE